MLLAGITHAQDFPTKPIRIIVGPGPDIIARLFGQKFTETWGQQIIVEQRPGGGGTLATDLVAKAPPDGYTLLLSSAAYTINAVLQPGPHDLVRDFASIALCATSPFILSVHPSVPAKSIRELIALAKARIQFVDRCEASNQALRAEFTTWILAFARMTIVVCWRLWFLSETKRSKTWLKAQTA
jgi:tripartite-type tricarboxylate transporter receptor subunit TctC